MFGVKKKALVLCYYQMEGEIVKGNLIERAATTLLTVRSWRESLITNNQYISFLRQLAPLLNKII